MYIFVKSTDCLDVFPQNVSNCFKVRLPDRLRSSVVNKCCLTGLVLPPFRDPGVEEVYILTNFVKDSIVGSGHLPIVCRYINSSRLNKVNVGLGINYLAMKNIDTDVIEVKVLNSKSMQLVNFQYGILYCTFHFIYAA